MWGNGIALPCALYVMEGLKGVTKMNKFCAMCRWCETDPFTADMVCANEDSEWCGDQVGEDWSCEEWKMNGDEPYRMEDE